MKYLKKFESVRWGSVGAGILPFCKKTNRFLIPLRSVYVYEPHTWGVWGGKIDSGDVSIEHSATREFEEECGVKNIIKELIPSYVYQENNFTYYNFIGIIESEFAPNLSFLNEFGELETEDYRWVTLQELVKISPKHFGLQALIDNNYDQLESLCMNSNIFEGIDFEGNFTPLYHITYRLSEILKADSLIPGNPIRGPKGICFTRSKYFSHGGLSIRLILNRELLLRDGYRIYPLDEWALSRPKDIKTGKEATWPYKGSEHVTKRSEWVNKSAIKSHQMGKSNFNALKSGKRPISHNIKGLPNKSSGLEVEYEERILTPVKNLGKYIYAINFVTPDFYTKSNYPIDKLRDTIMSYIEKYPHIKILTGLHRFEEIK